MEKNVSAATRMGEKTIRGGSISEDTSVVFSESIDSRKYLPSHKNGGGI